MFYGVSITLQVNNKKNILYFLIFLCSNTVAQNPFQPTGGFHLFVKEGATLVGSEIQGPVAMGGNFNVNGNITLAPFESNFQGCEA